MPILTDFFIPWGCREKNRGDGKAFPAKTACPAGGGAREGQGDRSGGTGAEELAGDARAGPGAWRHEDRDCALGNVAGQKRLGTPMVAFFVRVVWRKVRQAGE